jgi:hypothetical protein
MIVSVSRRTDIPAYYAAWFMGRVDSGYCLVANPFDARRITRVSLKGEDVDFLVFWTRDPRPLIPHLPELEARGLRFYFQMTISGYPPEVEPGAPPLDDAIGAMRELISALGSRRVIWRYDPIFVARPDASRGAAAPPKLDADWHRANFARIASSLAGTSAGARRGGPERVVFSVLDEYSGTARALGRAGYPEAVFGSPRFARATTGAEGSAASVAQRELFAVSEPHPERRTLPEPYPALLADLAAIARSKGMAPSACAEPFDLSGLGIASGACVDRSLASSVWGAAAGIARAEGKDAGQRGACRCAPSVDIGSYGSCPRGCVYCYATRGRARLLERGPGDERL